MFLIWAIKTYFLNVFGYTIEISERAKAKWTNFRQTKAKYMNTRLPLSEFQRTYFMNKNDSKEIFDI